jgi:flagellar hook assembly protein FlgD
VAEARPSPRLFLRDLPNPLRPGDVVRYAVAATSDGVPVRLCIYDLTGREIRVLSDRRQSPGEYRVSWDGGDASGLPVRSGVYFYTATQGAARESRAVVFVR